MRFNVHGLAFTAFLGALSALPSLAIDMALPSLAMLQADFGATQTQAASAIAIFLAGFSTAPIVTGPLSDRYGRKPIMLGGILLYLVSAVGCALAPSIGVLLAFRCIQGIGAGSVGLLPRAIIRDLFEGHESRIHIAAVSMAFSVAPLIAPSLGAMILSVGSWRLIYVLLTAVGVLLAVLALVLFAESQPPKMRRSIRPASVVAGYRRALTTRMCAGFALVNGLAFAGLMAYVNVSPLLFIQGYGVSKAGFSVLFAMTASGVLAGSLINNWLVRRRVTPRTMLDGSLTLISVAGLALLAVGLLGVHSLPLVVAPIMVYISLFGLVVPSASHEAVHPLPDMAGVASAILLSAQMLFGALGGVTAAALYRDASPVAIAAVMSGGSLAAAAIYAIWLRPHIKA